MKSSRIKRVFALGSVLTVAAAILIACTPPPEPTATPTPVPPPPDVGFSISAESVMAPLEVDFTVDSPRDGVGYSWEFGDGNRATGPTVSHTYLDAGQFNATLRVQFEGDVLANDRVITVQPGAAGWLVLNADSVELESGDAFRFEVQAFDELGNAVDPSSVVWNADATAGTITHDGVFVAGPTVGSWEAGVVASFERAGAVATAEVPVQIVYGEPSTLLVEPESIDTKVTWEVDLRARVFDDAGHELEEVEVEWEALRPGDKVSNAGEYVPGTVVATSDSALVVARIKAGDAFLTKIVRGIVEPGVLDEVQISPPLPLLSPSEFVQLTAVAYDRFGNDVALDSVEWKLNTSVLGDITPNGFLTVGNAAGRFGEESLEVRGYKDGVESVAYYAVEISPDEAATVEFRYPDDSVPAGAASPLEVEVKDKHGNLIDDAQVQFQVLGGGRLAVADVFVAGLDPGIHIDAISATVSGTNGESASEDAITTSTSVVVRQRSSDFIAIDVEDVQSSAVYMINLITAQMVPVSRDFILDDADEQMPAWMPDGTRLLITSNATGEDQIYMVDPFHNLRHQVTDLPGGASMSAPNPMGGELAFVTSSNAAGGWDVVVAPLSLDENGSPEARINADDLVVVSWEEDKRNILPYWSPTGEWLMYTAVDDRNSANVYIVDPDNLATDSVIEVRGASGLAWHPNGNEILITSPRQTTAGIVQSVPFTVNLISGVTREVEVGGKGVSVASFSPDGTELAFVDEDSGALWLMDSDGTGLRQAVGGQFQTTITSWRPRTLELPTDESRFQPFPNEVISRAEVELAIQDQTPLVQIVTDAGTLMANLYSQVAPRAVANFIYLALNGYYDGLAFHTVESGAAYTGSITDGFGGMAGYYITSELNPNALHDRPGVLSMVASRAGTVSTEFVVSLDPNPEWDGFIEGQPRNCDILGSNCHVVFGQVVDGVEVLTSWEPITPFDVNSVPHRIIEINVLSENGQLFGTRQ